MEAVKNNTVFENSEKVVRECSNCGHVAEGDNKKKLCHVYIQNQAYFFIKKNNY